MLFFYSEPKYPDSGDDMPHRILKRQINVPEKLRESKKYEIALSFTGEDRTYAEALANALSARGIKFFYDKHEKAFLWGEVGGGEGNHFMSYIACSRSV